MQTKTQTIANEAYDHYASAIDNIERIRHGIEENRKGEIPLAEISKTPEQLAERIAREGLPIAQALERINGVPNFQDILILKKIFKISESVGRITIKNQYGTSGFGTGFLIAPGIIITNNHVFPDAATAAGSYIQFNYELDDKGQPLSIYTFGLEPEAFFLTSGLERISGNPFTGLDFTIVAVAEKSKEGKYIKEVPFVRLDERQGKITEGESCIVIQHPQGDYKKIVMKDIRMITCTEDFLIYESDTLPGSSGAVVVGLGTGEVVALHHSGVPRKNSQGQWLRKDGGVYQLGDPDDSIDWIGNEGIRISRILNCLKNGEVPESMSNCKQDILSYQFLAGAESKKSPTSSLDHTILNASIMNNNNTQNSSVVSRAINILQNNIESPDGSLQYFEVELSANEDMQDHWKENYRTLIPEIVSSEAIFPLSTVPSQRRFFYLSIKSNDNPWELAAKLEALPQITIATPDLSMDTDLQVNNESATSQYPLLYESSNDGTAVWNETGFKIKWRGSRHFKKNESDHLEDPASMRRWNRAAVGLDGSIEDMSDWKEVKSNIAKIKLVQLDTGYTDHSKVKGGFDLLNDEDFIDGDDARDEMASGVLNHPGHGTRTASIIIGKKIQNSSFTSDGNFGILRNADSDLNVGKNDGEFKLVPYRIAQSVILIGRGKNLVDAANQAINSNTDVIFMCMGSYPRPMIYEVAKAAYDMGVIWVCAAGNEVEMVVAPALYPGTVAVAAVNPFDLPWKGSSYGDSVDIAAPGEDVYVPFINKKNQDIMVYGSGTSYATPHVASAAVLWRAKHYDQLKRYQQPWKIIEAFKHCLGKSARKPVNWDEENYGAGILDIPKLLTIELPELEDRSVELKYAYKDKPARPEWDLGIREAAHYLWKTLVKKITPGPESTSPEMLLTERARISISALTAGPASNVFESYTQVGREKSEKILSMYFESYQ